MSLFGVADGDFYFLECHIVRSMVVACMSTTTNNCGQWTLCALIPRDFVKAASGELVALPGINDWKL